MYEVGDVPKKIPQRRGKATAASGTRDEARVSRASREAEDARADIERSPARPLSPRETGLPWVGEPLNSPRRLTDAEFREVSDAITDARGAADPRDRTAHARIALTRASVGRCLADHVTMVFAFDPVRYPRSGPVLMVAADAMKEQLRQLAELVGIDPELRDHALRLAGSGPATLSAVTPPAPVRSGPTLRFNPEGHLEHNGLHVPLHTGARRKKASTLSGLARAIADEVILRGFARPQAIAEGQGLTRQAGGSAAKLLVTTYPDHFVSSRARVALRV